MVLINISKHFWRFFTYISKNVEWNLQVYVACTALWVLLIFPATLQSHISTCNPPPRFNTMVSFPCIIFEITRILCDSSWQFLLFAAVTIAALHTLWSLNHGIISSPLLFCLTIIILPSIIFILLSFSALQFITSFIQFLPLASSKITSNHMAAQKY